jgi:hypothetical protein
MTKQTSSQTERQQNPTHVLKTNKVQYSTTKENVADLQTKAKEVKQAHQTYIYRSFGGGYQGL